MYYLDYILTGDTLYFVWVVPLPQTYPQWMNIIFPLQPLTWVNILLALLTVSLCFEMFQNHKVYRFSLSFHYPLMDTLSILLGLSTPTAPSQLSLTLLFKSWILVSMVVNTSYQAALLGFLTKPKMYQKLTLWKILYTQAYHEELDQVSKICSVIHPLMFQKIFMTILYH